MITTLMGNSYFTAVSEVGHQHGEAAIAHKRYALAIGIGELRRNGVRQSRRHGREIAREAEHLPAFDGICRAHQVAIVPLSQLTMASLRKRLPNSQATTCGFMGLSMRVARFSISSHHSFIPACAVSRKLRSFLRFSSGMSSCSTVLTVAHQANLDGVAQADALGIDVDLHALCLPRFRQDTRCRETNVPTISSVSQSSIASCEGSVPSSPMEPVV